MIAVGNILGFVALILVTTQNSREHYIKTQREYLVKPYKCEWGRWPPRKMQNCNDAGCKDKPDCYPCRKDTGL